jgi:hypothetical protein
MLPHLHCVACSGLVTHHADLCGLGADELQAMVRTDFHKASILRQEAIALQQQQFCYQKLWVSGCKMTDKQRVMNS